MLWPLERGLGFRTAVETDCGRVDRRMIQRNRGGEPGLFLKNSASAKWPASPRFPRRGLPSEAPGGTGERVRLVRDTRDIQETIERKVRTWDASRLALRCGGANGVATSLRCVACKDRADINDRKQMMIVDLRLAVVAFLAQSACRLSTANVSM
jgi:hypothetical protein